jgi:bacillopeptidase F (M6 metalloprotease family)
MRTLFLTLAILTYAISALAASSQEVKTLWFEDWEDPSWTENWHADQGTWNAGIPTSGPGGAYDGENCAATMLDEHYIEGVRSRLIRHESFTVPSADENPRLRFWHWYSISKYDYGKVQIRAVGSDTWEDISESYVNTGSGIWTRPSVDLSLYAGEDVHIAFYFYSQQGSYEGPSVSYGWYIDDVTVIAGDVVFSNPETWELGLGDWSSEKGTWEVGIPTTGPGEAYDGENCAATVLDTSYHEWVQSRLVSPTFTVPSSEENPRLRFKHWHSFSKYDYGRVQIRVGGTKDWMDLPEAYYTGTSAGVWTYPYLQLSDYADSLAQIAFYFDSRQGSYEGISVSSGWYIDDIAIEPISTDGPGSDRVVKLQIPDQSAELGDIVSVPIDVDDATDIAGMELVLAYDPNLLTGTSAELTPLT